MSHSAERKEKICLNCNASLIGLYCHNCGQENKEPKESIWHFSTHFFNDITHFDGKFFTTLKDLLFRPGFLSKEFMLGRRVAYLDPVRMYLFTSFIFFLAFFSMNVNFVGNTETGRKVNGQFISEILALPAATQDSISASYNGGKPMSRKEFENYLSQSSDSITFGDARKGYKTIAQYDSIMKIKGKKDSWLEHAWVKKEIEINQKYHGKGNDLAMTFQEIMIHKFPQILFISLPFVALFLKLLYIRRKKFYYVSHAVFSIQLYIFIFIVMLVQMLFTQIDKAAGISVLSYFNYALTFCIFFYLYKAMRNFYGQGRLKTFFKYLLFLFSFFILIIALLVIFVLLSIMQV